MNIRSIAARLAVFSVLCATPAMATGTPIPGIDIVVKTNPGGIAIKAGDCKPPKGTLKQDAHGKWECVLTQKTTTGAGTGHN
jgi:hypothetical protein